MAKAKATTSTPTLVYDGNCGVCLRSVDWLRRRLVRPVHLVASQDIDLARYDLTQADVARAAWWIDERGRKLAGHRAIAHALGACRRAWPGVGWALRLPPISQLAWLGYRLMARWRHHLPFSTNTGGRCDQGTR